MRMDVRTSWCAVWTSLARRWPVSRRFWRRRIGRKFSTAMAAPSPDKSRCRLFRRRCWFPKLKFRRSSTPRIGRRSWAAPWTWESRSEELRGDDGRLLCCPHCNRFERPSPPRSGSGSASAGHAGRAEEIKRHSELSHLGLVAPYLIECRTEDTVSHGIGASLGALLESVDSAFRVPSVRVRVGNYEFDNTNHIFSEAYDGRRYDPERLSLDDNYLAFREVYWLATDRAFKTAEDAIARKRSSLKNVSLSDGLPDFSKATPAQLILPIKRQPVALDAWKK